MSFLPLVRIWIVLSALASATGWLLSAIGHLDRVGYFIVFGCAAIIYLLSEKRKSRNAPSPARLSAALGRRFRRLLPAFFVLLALLVFVGGAIYPPTNHTALSYRTA